MEAGAYVTLDEGFATSGDVAHVVGDSEAHRYRRASFLAWAPFDMDDLIAEIDRLRNTRG